MESFSSGFIKKIYYPQTCNIRQRNRQWNFSIICRRCSNYIFILDLTPGCWGKISVTCVICTFKRKLPINSKHAELFLKIIQDVFTFRTISWILFNRREPNLQWSNATCCPSYTDNTMLADALATLGAKATAGLVFDPQSWNISSPASEELKSMLFNSLWPSDTVCQHRTWSSLVQVMACSQTAPSHYLNQCWLIISEVLWHSTQAQRTIS